jgi:hypothetical protein
VRVTAAPPEWDPSIATVGFTLTGPAVPSIVVTPDSTAFTGTAFGSASDDQGIAITNGGTGTLTGLTAEIGYAAGASDWLEVTLDATTRAGNADGECVPRLPRRRDVHGDGDAALGRSVGRARRGSR